MLPKAYLSFFSFFFFLQYTVWTQHNITPNMLRSRLCIKLSCEDEIALKGPLSLRLHLVDLRALHCSYISAVFYLEALKRTTVKQKKHPLGIYNDPGILDTHVL